MKRQRQAWHRALAAGCAAVQTGAGCALAAAEDIRDIRVPRPQTSAWLPAALAAAALLCLVALALLWRRHIRGRTPPPAALALRQLEQAHALIRQGKAGEFCVETSGIVRRYVEQAFDTAATDRTTEEFLQSLAQSPDARLGRHRARLAEFLETCDLVKFGGLAPPPQLLESVYQGARAFVQESTAEAEDALSAA